MDRDKDKTQRETPDRDRPATAPPPEARNQAAAPPANPPVDEDAVEKGRDRLDRTGH